MQNINQLIFSFVRLLLILFSVLFISGYRGCSQVASSKEHAEFYVNQNIIQIIKLYGDPVAQSKNKNGNQLYAYQINKNYNGTCTAIWEVNPSGIIIGYELKGKGCD